MSLQTNDKTENEVIIDKIDPSISEKTFEECNENRDDDNENGKMIESSTDNSFSLFADINLTKKRTSSIIAIALYLGIMVIIFLISLFNANYAKINLYLQIQSKMFHISSEYMLILFSFSISKYK